MTQYPGSHVDSLRQNSHIMTTTMISTITPAERRLAQCLHDDIAVLRYYGKGLMTAVSHNTIPRIFGPQDVMVRQSCCDMPIPTKLSTHIMSDHSAKSRAASLRTERREIVTGGVQGRKTREQQVFVCSLRGRLMVSHAASCSVLHQRLHTSALIRHTHASIVSTSST